MILFCFIRKENAMLFKRKFKFYRFSAVILSAVFCFFLFCFQSCAKNDGFSLTVLVTESEGVSVKSDNPLKVPYGGNAKFELGLEDGKTVVGVMLDGAAINKFEYKNGILTIPNITSPHTVLVSAGEKGQTREFWLSSNSPRGGGIRSTPGQGRVAKGSAVTVTASPNDGAVFLGWSSGASLERGGKLISKTEQHTFTVNEDITIFANYDASGVAPPVKKDPPKIEIPEKNHDHDKPKLPWQTRNDVVAISYDAAGGKTADGNSVLETDFCIDYYTMPNSLPDSGIFTREGYVLTGYNTAPDGSGTDIGIGHKFKYSDGMTLYCMWKKSEPEQSFEYSEKSGYVTITKYNGSSKKVYIPKTLNGMPVTRIEDGAFSGSGISYAYIPPTVLSVGDTAFSGCASLEKITFFDSLQRISDNSFRDSALKTIELCAASNPRYSDTDLSFGKKYERFTEGAEKGMNRLIIVSGSSKHFGFDSEYAEELLDGKYFPVNYGTNAQMNVVFFLEAMANLAQSGDIILFAPEQYGPYCDTVNGNPEMTALTFQGCESCYNLLSYVDISKYTNVFASYSQYSAQRAGMSEKSYERYSFNIDKYGDCSISRKNYNGDNYRNGANGTFYFKSGTVPEEFAQNVNRIISVAEQRGIPVYLGYPPYNLNACDAETLNDAGFDEYNADMQKVFSSVLISDARSYIFEGKYFYNTDYHLNEEGARIHTAQVIKDIVDFGL